MAVPNGCAVHPPPTDKCSLILTLGQIRVTIPVSAQLDEWTVAEVLKDEFTHKQSQRDAVDTTAQLENEVEATIELSARFLAYVAESITGNQSTHAHTALLLNVFKYFASTYLASNDIYLLTSIFDTDTHKTVLSAYFLAVAALKARDRCFNSKARIRTSYRCFVRKCFYFCPVWGPTLTNSKISMTFINLSWPHSSRRSLKTFLCP